MGARARTARLGTAVALAAALTGGCGGGSGSSAAVSGPSGADPSRVVVLDSGNFDALVLSLTRPSLVEFQSPT